MVIMVVCLNISIKEAGFVINSLYNDRTNSNPKINEIVKYRIATNSRHHFRMILFPLLFLLVDAFLKCATTCLCMASLRLDELSNKEEPIVHCFFIFVLIHCLNLCSN